MEMKTILQLTSFWKTTILGTLLWLGIVSQGQAQYPGLAGPYTIYASVSGCSGSPTGLADAGWRETNNGYSSADCLNPNSSQVISTFPNSLSVFFQWTESCAACADGIQINSSTNTIAKDNILLGTGNANITPPVLATGPTVINNSICETEDIVLNVLTGTNEGSAITYLANKNVRYRWSVRNASSPAVTFLGETTTPTFTVPGSTFSSELVTNSQVEKVFICQLATSSGVLSMQSTEGQTVFIYRDAPTLKNITEVNWGTTTYDIDLKGNTVGRVTIKHNTCSEGTNATVEIDFNNDVTGLYRYSLRGGTGVTVNMTSGAGGGSDIFPTHSSDSGFEMRDGSYTLTIENLVGGQLFCLSTNSFTIKSPPAVTLTPSLIEPVSCRNGNDGEIQVQLGGGIISQAGVTGSFNVQIFNGSTPGEIKTGIPANGISTFVGLSPGNHSFVVTENNGCGTITKSFPRDGSDNATTFNLVNPSIIGMDITQQGIPCRGGTGSLTVKLKDGSTSSTYQVEIYNATTNTKITPTATINPNTLSNSGEVTFSGLTEGKYKVIASNVNGTCSSDATGFSADYDFINPPVIVASLTEFQAVSCNGVADGIVNVSLSGGNGSNTYDIELVRTNNNQSYGTRSTTSGGSTVSFPNLPEGNYEARVTQQTCNNPAGNTETFSITLAEPNPITATINKVILFDIYHVTCNNDSDGSITVAGVAGGNGNYTIRLQDAIGGGILATRPNATSTTFDNLTAGTYDVLISDSKGCVLNTFGLVLEAPPAIGTNLIPTRVQCKGESNGSVAATITGGVKPYTIQWINVTTGTPATAEITLGATESAHTLTGQPAGDYKLMVKDTKGCPNKVTGNWYESTTVTIDEPTNAFAFEITSFVIDAATCNGGSDGQVTLAVTGGWGSYTYSQNGTTYQASPTFSGFGSGIYTLYARDAEGCTISTQVTIQQPEPLTLTQQQITQVSCNGGYNGVLVFEAKGGNDAGSQPYTILLNGAAHSETDWSSWGTNKQITLRGLAAGMYTIQATDPKGCSETLGFTITEPALLNATVSNVVTATCGERNGSAQVTATGGTTPYTYAWKKYDATSGTLRTWSTTTNLTNAEGGAYEMIVTDALGCSITQIVQISNADAAQTTIQNIQATSCAEGKDGSATLTLSGDFPVEVTWVNAANETGTITPQNASTVQLAGLSKGYHDFQTKDSKGCVRFETVLVSGPETLLITRDNSSDPTCHNGTDGSLGITISGGTTPYTITWDNGLAAGATAFNNLAAGTYTVQVTDANGCQRQASFILQNPLPITVDLGTGSTICEGQSVTLRPTIPAGNTVATYQWTSASGNFISAASEVTVSTADTYFLQVTTTTGCTGTGQYQLETSTDLFEADFLMADEAFVGDTVAAIEVCRPAPTTVFWDIEGLGNQVTSLAPTSTTPDQKLIYNTAGTYTVKLYASAGNCQDVYTHQITIRERDGQRAGNGQAAQTGQNAQQIQAQVSPNPVSDGKFKITVDLAFEASVKVEMFSLSTGKRWRLPTPLQGTGQTHYQWTLDMPELTYGTYAVRIQTPAKQEIIKVVVN